MRGHCCRAIGEGVTWFPAARDRLLQHLRLRLEDATEPLRRTVEAELAKG